MVHMKPNHRKQAVEVAESLGAQTWHFKMDTPGLQTWTEPRSSAEEVRSIRIMLD